MTSNSAIGITPGSVCIRRATLADAASLAELASRTFREAFGADNSPENLALHLARSYGLQQQAAELADPAVTTLLAEVEGHPAGYTQLGIGPTPPCVVGPASLEIMRFYVEREWHGRGLAQRLMESVHAEARRLGASTLWLGVWERNPRAIAFYEKSGFVSTGNKTFRLGNDEQNDVVMVKPL
jgi:GNAT superfamily N-acetyltransferase